MSHSILFSRIVGEWIISSLTMSFLKTSSLLREKHTLYQITYCSPISLSAFKCFRMSFREAPTSILHSFVNNSKWFLASCVSKLSKKYVTFSFIYQKWSNAWPLLSQRTNIVVMQLVRIGQITLYLWTVCVEAQNETS